MSGTFIECDKCGRMVLFKPGQPQAGNWIRLVKLEPMSGDHELARDFCGQECLQTWLADKRMDQTESQAS